MSSPIGRATLLEHLAMAEWHITEGSAIINRQKALILELESHGHDTSRSRALLCRFEEIQQSHMADRARLIAELAQP